MKKGNKLINNQLIYTFLHSCLISCKQKHKSHMNIPYFCFSNYIWSYVWSLMNLYLLDDLTRDIRNMKITNLLHRSLACELEKFTY